VNTGKLRQSVAFCSISIVSQSFAVVYRSIFRAVAGRGLVFFENPDGQIDLGEESSSRKLMIGIFVALGSFSASSPHFFLNLLTVFSCSISLVSSSYPNFEFLGLPLIDLPYLTYFLRRD
jgi:hypothetical protein